MSSILKALKKAEQDGSLYRTNPDLKINLQRIFDSKAWNSTGKSSFTLPKILLTLGILVITGSVCFYIFSTNDKPDKSSSVNHATVLKAAPSLKSETLPKTLPETLPVIISEDIPEVKDPDPISAPPKLSDPMPANEIAQNPTKDIQTDDAIEEIKEDSFKVQAISWAKNPEDRIAVVNNTIVVENDFIQDYRILTIGKDEVILEKSGGKLRLKFNYR